MSEGNARTDRIKRNAALVGARKQNAAAGSVERAAFEALEDLAAEIVEMRRDLENNVTELMESAVDQLMESMEAFADPEDRREGGESRKQDAADEDASGGDPNHGNAAYWGEQDSGEPNPRDPETGQFVAEEEQDSALSDR